MKKNILKDKNFLLYFIGMFVTSIGDIFYSFAVSWYILELTGSATQAGLYLAFGAIIKLILSNFGAALVDRMDKVKIMYFTDFIRGIAIIITGFIIFSTSDKTIILTTLYITASIMGTLGSLFGPATSALIKYMVPEESLQQANSYLQIKNSVQSIIGMASAGFIYSFLGISGVFILNGVTFIISGFTELFIQVETQEEIEGKTTFKQLLSDIKEGWVYIYNKPTIFSLMLIMVFLNFPFALLFGIGLPYLFNQTLGVAPSYLSYVNVVRSVAMILMLIYLSTKELGDKYYKNLRKYMTMTTVFYLLSISVVYVMGQALLAFNVAYALFLISMALLAMSNGGVSVPMQTFLAKSFDKEMFARSMAVIGIMSTITYPLASSVGGLIIDTLGLNVLLLFALVIYIICFVWFLCEKGIKKI